MSVQFNKKETLVAGGSNDNSIKIWNMVGNMDHSLMGHIGKVVSAKFTPLDHVISGSSQIWIILILASHDRTIKIWDLTKGYCIKTIMTLSSCNDICLSEGDGSFIVSGHLDNGIRMW